MALSCGATARLPCGLSMFVGTFHDASAACLLPGNPTRSYRALSLPENSAAYDIALGAPSSLPRPYALGRFERCRCAGALTSPRSALYGEDKVTTPVHRQKEHCPTNRESSHECDISPHSLRPWCLSTPLIIGMIEIIQLSVSSSLITVYASL